MAKKPNILVMYSDQHSARALGCYGNTQIKTPNLDALSASGVQMNNAFCNNPICTPSRMCMLSGQYVHNFGYYGLAGECPEHLPSMFDHTRSSGYTNGVVGKIHTPAGWVSKGCDFVADGYGFETPVTLENRVDEEGCQGLRDDDYAAYLKALGLYQDRDDKVLHEQFDLYEHRRGQGIDARPSRLPDEHSFESWCAKEAKKFITTCHEKDEPFCLWLTLPRPHQTYCPSQKYWDLYEGVDLELPPNAQTTMEHRSAVSREKLNNFKTSTDWMNYEPKEYEAARRRVLRGYYACVSQSDAAYGEVLATLEALGIADDTIIVYTTDHGEFAGEHGMIEKAPGISFSCVTHIPMIWKYKGCPQGEKREGMVESVDILPTLCDIAGLPAPNWVDGKTIRPTIEEGASVKTVAVTENPHTKTIHTAQYKLTQFLPEFHDGEEFGELYDRINDPWELKNLYFEPAYQSVVNDLRYQLYCWLVRNTRNKTVNPRIPRDFARNAYDVDNPWDLASTIGLLEDDDKVGDAFVQKLIAIGHKLYL